MRDAAKIKGAKSNRSMIRDGHPQYRNKGYGKSATNSARRAEDKTETTVEADDFDTKD
jgi:hypothetical protein